MDSEKLNDIHTDLKKVMKILLGNGEAGLCERVRDLQQFQERVEKKPQNIQTYLMIGVAILTIITGIKTFFS